MDSRGGHHLDGDDHDEDREVRREAIRFVARRALIWFVPIAAIGWLMIGLGLPEWAVVVACLLAYATAVFELDL